MSEISKSDVRDIYLNNSVGNRIFVCGAFLFVLFIASAYIIDIAHQQRQTLSIVVKPCGNEGEHSQAELGQDKIEFAPAANHIRID